MADHETRTRRLDARPDRMDFRDLEYRPPLVSLPHRYPSDYEVAQFLPIIENFPIVEDQKKQGACTGFGLAAVINYIYWNRTIRLARQQVQAEGGPDESGGESEQEAVCRMLGLKRFTRPDDTPGFRAEVEPKVPLPDPVSPQMLYHVARIYDEWEGEDYSGSSCRGALKGWHKHGVCKKLHWNDGGARRPDPEWQMDAAQRPLGAYYRVNARSIGDLQAAIFEVRAVFCSARVHDGWERLQGDWKKNTDIEHFDIADGIAIPVIPRGGRTGGHAFALVGYTSEGFIVQNSWGDGWGLSGFAILPYEDWAENGNDAWVAALAAPMRVASQASRTEIPLALKAATAPSAARGIDPFSAAGGHAATKIGTFRTAPQPWSADHAYLHCMVMGNEGRLIRRRVDTVDADDNLRLVAFDQPLERASFRGAPRFDLLVYAHGGLNSERAAVARAMRLGPWLEANGIHPVFLIWRTSLLESLSNIREDLVAQFEEKRDDLRSEAIGDALQSAIDKLQTGFDKAFETAAESTIGKPVWTQIKQNAASAAAGQGGLRKLAAQIVALRDRLAEDGIELRLHLMGHSAGAIPLGHMLDDMRQPHAVRTVSLFAPACSMAFAVKHFGGALGATGRRTRVLADGALHVDNLSDANERRDTVGPYGKSLLYLVSRALEDPRKQPLLGLAKCWSPVGDPGSFGGPYLRRLRTALAPDFAESEMDHVRDWQKLVAEYGVTHGVHGERELRVKSEPDAWDPRETESGKTISATHGDIDNDVDILNAALTRILGHEPGRPITDLTAL